MIGEVRIFAGNFAPRGWALCEGQLLAINSNQALFSILLLVFFPLRSFYVLAS